MSNLRTSCLVLLLLLLLLFSSFHHLSCASSKKEPGWCKALFQCGNITAGFPFWGGNRSEVCGHPLLELRCHENNYTSLIITNQLYSVRHIDQRSNTLRLARRELQGSFCNATFTATRPTTLPPEIFELSPNYRNLTVFYLCDPTIPHPSSNTCPDRGLVSVSQDLGYRESCGGSFTINVPKSYIPEEKVLNLINLENTLKEGFEVKVQIDEKACQECSSFNGMCGFQNTTQVCCKETSSSECNTLHLPDDYEYHLICSKKFSCGDQKDLFYPFWVPGREACGHPDFKLDCSGQFAEFNISSIRYRVLNMSYDSPVIRLARSDDINNLCPSVSLNAPFNQIVLPLVPGTDLVTLYYDCNYRSVPDSSSYLGELPCGNDTDDTRRYYVTTNLSSASSDESSGLLDIFKTSCRRNVSIPVSKQALDEVKRSPSPDNLEKVLDQNFELGLNYECTECRESGGACEYNRDSKSFNCYCPYDYQPSRTCSSRKTEDLSSVGEEIGSAVGLILTIVLVLTLCRLILQKREIPHDLILVQQNKALIIQPKLEALIPLKQYSYAQVKRITKSFAEVVGRGGFGTVYRGILSDGRSVAVKVLKDSKGNGEDFINEVASLSQTSHVNILTLLGFCFEGSKRAILYEFLENGSLDMFISSKRSSNLNSRELYEIAIGVGRGIEYLHHGCRTRIVHFDIKPQNVLLDDNLCPKVSDFGLAKLCKREESILSLLDTRGTIGYIAPELFSRVYGRASYKSDVYSYGMLVLEMIGARTKTSTGDTASSTSSMYFPEWIYKDLEKGDDGRLIENRISSDEEDLIKKMTLVALWCIQSWPSNRPPMNKVVEMMEGNLNALEVPPRPVLQIPATPLQDNSSDSDVCSMNVP